jgi:hypothetical protein
MPSPFPGMGPYLEQNPIFHELHTQMLAEAQALLQPQLRPRWAGCANERLRARVPWGALSLPAMPPSPLRPGSRKSAWSRRTC